MRKLTHNDVPYILINFLGPLIDFHRDLAGFLCGLVDFLRDFAGFLCGLVDLLRAPINPPGSTVDALQYRCLPSVLDSPLGEVRDTYLIVHDGVS